jgi:hypothetical protein
MYVYSVFVLSCVQVAALQLADHPSKESYRLCKKIKKFKQRGVDPLIVKFSDDQQYGEPSEFSNFYNSNVFYLVHESTGLAPALC